MKNKLMLLTAASAFSMAGIAADYTNIVLINLDDVGYGDFSFNGAYGYTTPNIDKMAAEGVRFTHFLVGQPISGASRAGLLTGCYPNRIGFSGAPGPDSNYGVHPEEMTIAEVLKQKGYSTAIFGKWHLGSQKEFLPCKMASMSIMGCRILTICGHSTRNKVRSLISQICRLMTEMRLSVIIRTKHG